MRVPAPRLPGPGGPVTVTGNTRVWNGHWVAPLLKAAVDRNSSWITAQRKPFKSEARIRNNRYLDVKEQSHGKEAGVEAAVRCRGGGRRQVCSDSSDLRPLPLSPPGPGAAPSGLAAPDLPAQPERLEPRPGKDTETRFPQGR